MGNEEDEMQAMENAVAEMMRAIALEENALSRLLNIQADHMCSFVGTNVDFPTHPAITELIQFNQSMIQLLGTMLMAEWLLLKKLETVAEIRNHHHTRLEARDRRNTLDY